MANERAALPPGRVSKADLEKFTALRRQEELTEARAALGERAADLSDEMVLRTFYREIVQNMRAAVPAN